MKNSKLIPNMILFALSALFLANCNILDTTIEPVENKDFSTINGNTIKTELFADYQMAEQQQSNSKNYTTVGDTIIIYRNPKMNVVAGSAPNLNNLKNNTDPDLAGKPLRMVSIGGSLTAGVRDGGYFNEGIETAYPALVARQMQISFKQPLFDDADFNGFGRKVPTTKNPTGGPVQKFNIVKNNTGVASATANTITLKKYKGTELDNFAVPYLNRGLLRPNSSVSSYNLNTDEAIKREGVLRIFNSTEGYISKLLSKKFDFITLEFRTSDILNNLLGGKANIGLFIKEEVVSEKPPYQLPYMFDMTTELELLRTFEEKNIKNAVLLNIPDFLSLPYFNSITPEMIKNADLGSKSYLIENLRLLPTSTVDSLLSPKVSIFLKRGLEEKKALTRSDVAGYMNDNNPCICEKFNNEIDLYSKHFGYPIVDIKGLYEKVIKGTFVSNDGLKVSSKDFFSSDGIYPTALGQACIANEVIKVMNTTYKTSIPLINIKEFK